MQQVRKRYRDVQQRRGPAPVVPWYHKKKNAEDRRVLVRALRDRGWTCSAIALVTGYAEHTVTSYHWFPYRAEEPSGRVREALDELLGARGWIAYEGSEYRPTGIDVSIEGCVKDAVRRGAGHPSGCRPIDGPDEYARVVAKLNADMDHLRALDDAILALENCPTEVLLASRDCLVAGLKHAAKGIRASVAEASS